MKLFSATQAMILRKVAGHVEAKTKTYKAAGNYVYNETDEKSAAVVDALVELGIVEKVAVPALDGFDTTGMVACRLCKAPEAPKPEAAKPPVA